MRDTCFWRAEVVSGTDTPEHALNEIIDRTRSSAYADAVAFGRRLARPGDAVRIVLIYDTGGAMLRAPVTHGVLPERFIDRWGRPDLPVPPERLAEVRAVADAPGAVRAVALADEHWHAPC